MKGRIFLFDEEGGRLIPMEGTPDAQEKILFENPRAILIVGQGLTDEQRRAIREKEVRAPAISLRTYDELVTMVRLLVQMVETAGQRVGVGIRTPT